MISKRRLAAALACTAAFAAAGTISLASQGASAGTTRTAGPAASSTFPRCLEQNLAGSLHGSQVGLGNRGFILTLANTGNGACSLDGYPGLGLQDSAHHVLPSQTNWGSTYFDTDPGPAVIVLSPGETASADFAYSSGTGGSSDSVAAYLEVTPPNAFTNLTVPIPGAPVRIARGRLFVTAMARHTAYTG